MVYFVLRTALSGSAWAKSFRMPISMPTSSRPRNPSRPRPRVSLRSSHLTYNAHGAPLTCPNMQVLGRAEQKNMTPHNRQLGKDEYSQKEFRVQNSPLPSRPASAPCRPRTGRQAARVGPVISIGALQGSIGVRWCIGSDNELERRDHGLAGSSRSVRWFITALAACLGPPRATTALGCH